MEQSCLHAEIHIPFGQVIGGCCEAALCHFAARCASFSYIDQSILTHAKRCGIRLCYVPASMTGDLQPCDTHLFWKFKSAFRDCWRRCKATRIGGSVTTCEWIEVVVAAIQQVLPANQWRSAFEATGILANQSGLTLSLMRKLCWTDVPAVPHGPPENHIAAQVFPKRMRINVNSYVLWQSKSSSSKRSQPDVPEAAGQQEPLPRRRRLPPTFQRIPITLD